MTDGGKPYSLNGPFKLTGQLGQGYAACRHALAVEAIRSPSTARRRKETMTPAPFRRPGPSSSTLRRQCPPGAAIGGRRGLPKAGRHSVGSGSTGAPSMFPDVAILALDHVSALKIARWWHCQQDTSSDRTPFARMCRASSARSVAGVAGAKPASPASSIWTRDRASIDPVILDIRPQPNLVPVGNVRLFFGVTPAQGQQDVPAPSGGPASPPAKRSRPLRQTAAYRSVRSAPMCAVCWKRPAATGKSTSLRFSPRFPRRGRPARQAAASFTRPSASAHSAAQPRNSSAHAPTLGCR